MSSLLMCVNLRELNSRQYIKQPLLLVALGRSKLSLMPCNTTSAPQVDILFLSRITSFIVLPASLVNKCDTLEPKPVQCQDTCVAWYGEHSGSSFAPKFPSRPLLWMLHYRVLQVFDFHFEDLFLQILSSDAYRDFVRTAGTALWRTKVALETLFATLHRP